MRSRLARSWWRTAAPLAGVALAAAVAVAACCVSGELKLGRVKAFLSGVFELTVELEVEGYTTAAFSGDLGEWASIPALDADRLDVDISAASFFTAYTDYDVDYDALDEAVVMLRAEGAGSGATTIEFARWRGDKYTVDKGVCYLGWFEGGDVTLAAAYCGANTGAMYCHMPNDHEELATCERCDEEGSCSACRMKQDLKECLPAKSGGGSLDLDIDIDIDIDVDQDADQHAEG